MTDLLLVNGTIHTMDPARPRARSVACTDGKVESLDETPPARRVLDLKGRTVVPGFIDAHVHLLAVGRRKREVDLTGVTDYAEVIRRVVERAKETPTGSWITGSGYELNEHPHHAALSAATPDHPVWLVRKDFHSGLANARAMEGGKGYPLDGIFVEDEMLRFQDQIPEPSPATDFLAAQRDAMQFGITGVHDAMVDEDYLRLLRSLEDGRSLRLRVHAMFWHQDPLKMIEFMRSTPPRTGRLSVRAIKLFMDGSLGSSTAWMLAPYAPEGMIPEGVQRLQPWELERVLQVALEKGWQVCAHAIGDRANRELLSVYERLNPPAEARLRVEHAQHVDPADQPRLARWIASIQPSHCVADRRMVESKLPGRVDAAYAWKGLGPLALGTDAPVDRLDPRWTFYCATTREGWGTSHCLSPQEALRGMTAGAAHAGFMESGELAPGRPADMAVLSHDWLEVPPREVLESRILATLMDGRVGYQDKEFRG
ncbi:MAG: amidohydrolase [Planctomycetota bacterium]|nr:MAG: amidohydrolase [Planctomycetota bacterium]